MTEEQLINNTAKKLLKRRDNMVNSFMGLCMKENPNMNPQQTRKILEDKFMAMILDEL